MLEALLPLAPHLTGPDPPVHLQLASLDHRKDNVHVFFRRVFRGREGSQDLELRTVIAGTFTHPSYRQLRSITRRHLRLGNR